MERTCDRWFVLSAKHGLVEPDRVLASYDETLTDLPLATRRVWSGQVVQALEEALGDLSGVAIELDAGMAYLDSGLAAGLILTRDGSGASGQRAFAWQAASVIQADRALSCSDRYVSTPRTVRSCLVAVTGTPGRLPLATVRTALGLGRPAGRSGRMGPWLGWNLVGAGGVYGWLCSPLGSVRGRR